MIIDFEQMFSDKQAVSASGYSANAVEIPAGLSAGIDMAVQIVVRSESGTDPTLDVELEASADDSAYAKLLGVRKPAGESIFSVPLSSISGLKKFLRLRYVLGGTSPAYNITAMLVPGGGHNSAQRIENLGASPRIA